MKNYFKITGTLIIVCFVTAKAPVENAQMRVLPITKRVRFAAIDKPLAKPQKQRPFAFVTKPKVAFGPAQFQQLSKKQRTAFVIWLLKQQSSQQLIKKHSLAYLQAQAKNQRLARQLHNSQVAKVATKKPVVTDRFRSAVEKWLRKNREARQTTRNFSIE
jgi:hypothetical protein